MIDCVVRVGGIGSFLVRSAEDSLSQVYYILSALVCICISLALICTYPLQLCPALQVKKAFITLSFMLFFIVADVIIIIIYF